MHGHTQLRMLVWDAQFNTLLYMIRKPYVCYTLMCHLHTVLDQAIRYSLYRNDQY